MGHPLKDLIDAGQVAEYNRRLVVALKVAHKFLEEERRVSWGWYKKQVYDALKAA